MLATETAPAGELETLTNILAGNAVFTAVGGGERYTYKLYIAKTGKLKGVVQVRLLTGPNNVDDYEEIGQFDANGVLILTGHVSHKPNSVGFIRWLVALARAGKPIPTGVEIHHAGYCLRCGRLLTVPYPQNPYRIYGLGPECGSK